MYIPRKREDIELATSATAATVDVSKFGVTDAAGNLITSVPYILPVAEQWTALDNFIKDEASLKDRRGQFAERNGAVAPWNHRFDLRLMQNIRYKAGSDDKKHTLQFTLDIINVGNLLNKNWGVIPTSVTNPVVAKSFNDVTGNVVYNINPTNTAVTATEIIRDAAGTPVLKAGLPQVQTATAEIVRNRNIVSLSSVWQMQFGIRYIF